jgi:type I restriction enzyme, S subunit
VGVLTTNHQVAEASGKYLAEVAGQSVPTGYKQTEVGVILEDWNAVQLRELFTLKNGYSFKGEFFSNKGPIVLTPGNFKLEGGLYFEERNTKRYSAEYPKSYEFDFGDLVVVMTDLTPDCNLLGKPAFVKSQEKILHNQRIGKIERLVKRWDRCFLYYSLLSPSYLSAIKNAATGSTVRHTSPSTIYSTWVNEPPITEQTAIANALSDVDALINELEKLIAKKQAIKTATMQQLLTGRTRLPQFAQREDGTPKGYEQSELGEILEDWEILKLGQLGKFKNGINKDAASFGYGFPFVNLMDVFGKPTISSKTDLGLINSTELDRKEYGLKDGDILFIRSSVKPSGVGLTTVIQKDLEDTVYSGFLIRYRTGSQLSNEFKEHCFYEEAFRNRIIAGSTVSANTNINQDTLKEILLVFPRSTQEQTAIATILSDMDSEIQTLQQRLSKTRQIKQGMMQELLTGKTRLLKPTPKESQHA